MFHLLKSTLQLQLGFNSISTRIGNWNREATRRRRGEQGEKKPTANESLHFLFVSLSFSLFFGIFYRRFSSDLFPRLGRGMGW